MTPKNGSATAADLGAPQTQPSDRPERYPLPLGGRVGVALAVIGFALIFFGMGAGPIFLDTKTVFPWLDSAVHVLGRLLIAGVPWGLVALVIGVVAYVIAGWLRPRYPGRLDFKNDLYVRLHDEFGTILHPGDCAIRVRRKHGVYRVLIHLRGNGLQYEDKCLAIVRAVTGMGFQPPEVFPYQGFRPYDLVAVVTARPPVFRCLRSLRNNLCNLYERLQRAIDNLHSRRRHVRR